MFHKSQKITAGSVWLTVRWTRFLCLYTERYERDDYEQYELHELSKPFDYIRQSIAMSEPAASPREIKDSHRHLTAETIEIDKRIEFIFGRGRSRCDGLRIVGRKISELR